MKDFNITTGYSNMHLLALQQLLFLDHLQRELTSVLTYSSHSSSQDSSTQSLSTGHGEKDGYSKKAIMTSQDLVLFILPVELVD